MATSKNYSRSVVAASDEVRDIYCEPCVDDGKQNVAEGFCVDCSEYLCGQCYKNHTRYKAFKQHVLQDKDKMPLFTTKADAKDVCVEKCSLHTTKIVEYFCRSCDTLGCHACITLNHRVCKNVDHIPSIVKDIEKSEEFKEFINGLDIKLEAVKERKKTLCSNSTETDVMKGKAKSMLIQQRDEIKKFFDQLEADMNKRIEDFDRENKETLKAESSACDSIYDDLETIKSNIKTKLKDGQKCELFIAMKNAKPKTERLDKELEKSTKESKIQSYVLAPSPQIKQVMESTSEICRLHRSRSAKYLHEINVRTKNDNKMPHICGLVIVQNQYLAVADNNNTSVKMVDTMSMSVKSEMNMNCTHVCCITCMSDDKIAVNTVSHNLEIRFKSSLCQCLNKVLSVKVI
ncbi:transcription intermediary factor 1-alpha-like [Mercenaria mercenaria]|uniref:transcription intermediary factor 1-alpha-like n=1 Tax=Mercenaria mercenaria TaxID=6596 RepID=UPI00234F3F26|nr:transcription intermediary factor 1-alpha-like [Mercenaria mercenaria]